MILLSVTLSLCFIFFSFRPPSSLLAAVCKVVSQHRSDLMKPQLMPMLADDGRRTQTTNLGLLASY